MTAEPSPVPQAAPLSFTNQIRPTATRAILSGSRDEDQYSAASAVAEKHTQFCKQILPRTRLISMLGLC